MLIGFLIRDKDDWYKWRKSVTEVQGKPAVHITDKEPMMEGRDTDRQSPEYNVEILDDEDESDGELIERP